MDSTLDVMQFSRKLDVERLDTRASATSCLQNAESQGA